MRLFAPALAASLACSPAPGYAVPTNFDLAAAANAIVLGQVVGGGVGSPVDPDIPAITVHPLGAIKGLVPGADFRIADMHLADPRDATANEASAPLEFAKAHPEAYVGACIRRHFPQGAEVLFFLSREDGQWVPAGGPFSRWAEDVTGPDAPWVRLASLYVEAARLPTDAGRELLEERYTALLDRHDDPEAAAMAADIERSLAGPPPPLRADFPSDPPDNAVPDQPGDLGEVQAAIDDFGKGD